MRPCQDATIARVEGERYTRKFAATLSSLETVRAPTRVRARVRTVPSCALQPLLNRLEIGPVH